MDLISFQNGFSCGMATRGLTNSAASYKPIIYNAPGEYDGFFIDFRYNVEEFTFGMLFDSMFIITQNILPIKGIRRISETIYFIECDITNQVKGVLVSHRPNSYLYFTDGKQVPQFSILFYVAGIESSFNLKYVYDEAHYDYIQGVHTQESESIIMCDSSDVIGFLDEVTYDWIPPMTVIENCSVQLL